MQRQAELREDGVDNPGLLILDDPTSGIDVPTRRDFLQDVIRELADAGTTVLFATHMVHELERIVERLFILHGGRLVLDEDYETVRRRYEARPPTGREAGFVGLEEIFRSFVS